MKTNLRRRLVGMKQRCNNPKHRAYKDYGGRGIYVCKKWEDSTEAFIEWSLSNGFKPELTIDRKNNDKGYSPGNCRWVTQKVQCRNQRVLSTTNKSGYRGVSWNRLNKIWEVSISVNNKTIKVGYYDLVLDAAKAYNTYVEDNNLEHTKNKVTGRVEMTVGGMRKYNTSGYVGVTAPKRIAHLKNCWSAQINKKGKRIFDKYCKSKEEAALYREHYIIKNNIEKTKRNFSDDEFVQLWEMLQKTIKEKDEE